MHDAAYNFLAAHELTYWYHAARNRLLARLLAGALPPDAAGRHLDIGCGTAGLLQVLHTRLPAVSGYGCERALPALRLARQHGRPGRLVNGTALSLPFADGSFASVSLIEILYHAWISNPADALREVRRVLQPGGVLLLVDAAHPFLEPTLNDGLQCCVRRFSRAQLDRALTAAGFRVSLRTSLHFLPLVFALLQHARRQLLPPPPPPAAPQLKFAPLPPALNRLLLWWYAGECLLARHRLHPGGTAHVYVARA